MSVLFGFKLNPVPVLGRHLRDHVDGRHLRRPGPHVGFRFGLKVLRADLGNFFLYQYRDVDGFLITGKNSGTHWLKYMLSWAIAHEHHATPPVFSSGPQANAIIGHPHWGRPYVGIPRIGSSHTIPSVAFRWPWLTRFAPHPPVVVLVRDIRSALLSNYVKWRAIYRVSLSEFVRGDPSGKRFVADLWWYIHFFNRWGDLAEAQPENVMVLHYEALCRDPRKALNAAAAHWGLKLSPDAIDAALRFATPEAIAAKLDPSFDQTVIPTPDAKAAVRFSREDEAFLDATLARYLRHDLGYGYCEPNMGGDIQEASMAAE
jgi:Sulfotransferase domain